MTIVRRLLSWLLKMSGVPPLPDFGSMTYPITEPPSGAALKAWPKLKECERRLKFFRYAVDLARLDEPRYRTLVDDATSAFLWSFEATFQFINDEKFTPSTAFRDWLEKPQPGYDLTVRGLRTLRNFEAHRMLKRSGVVLRQEISEPLGQPGATTQEQQRFYTLAGFTKADLSTGQKQPLDPSETGAWNELAKSKPIDTLFEDGLGKLKRILGNAERLP